MLTVKHIPILCIVLCALNSWKILFASELVVHIEFEDDVKLSASGIMCGISSSEQGAAKYNYETVEKADAGGIIHFKTLDAPAYWLCILPRRINWVKPDPFFGYIVPESLVKVEISPGESKTFTITLHRGSTITGLANKADGSPISKAYVGAVGLQRITGYFAPDGTFEVPGVAPGKPVKIWITPIDPQYRYTIEKVVPTDRLSPGSRVDLGAIEFQPLTGHPNFSGSLFDLHGELVKGIHTYSLNSESGGIRATLPIINGKFEVEVPPGKYSVVVATSRDLEGIEIAHLELHEGKLLQMDLTEPQIPLAPATQPESK